MNGKKRWRSAGHPNEAEFVCEDFMLLEGDNLFMIPEIALRSLARAFNGVFEFMKAVNLRAFHGRDSECRQRYQQV